MPWCQRRTVAELLPDILAVATQWEEGVMYGFYQWFCHNNSLF